MTMVLGAAPVRTSDVIEVRDPDDWTVVGDVLVGLEGVEEPEVDAAKLVSSSANASRSLPSSLAAASCGLSTRPQSVASQQARNRLVTETARLGDARLVVFENNPLHEAQR